MIIKKTYKSFAKTLQKKTRGLYPVSAQLELTYRCNLNCVHCYCIGTGAHEELTTDEWKRVLDTLYANGTIWLTITGGEPLLREDWFEIYEYAKAKGFLISLFSNGLLFDENIIQRLKDKPPYSIEITLNGVAKNTYEKIAGKNGTFEKVIRNIESIKNAKLPLVLKTIGMKENKGEIFEIKKYSDGLLGRNKFKFDSFIIPKLDGSRAPCGHRLSPQEIVELEESDPQMKKQRHKEFTKHNAMSRPPEYKYCCNSWFNQVYITPSGMLRFCHISERYSSDLRKKSFEEAFYDTFPLILEEKLDKDFKCVKCSLREYCHYCPARAVLETGRETAHIDYYCEEARLRKERTRLAARKLKSGPKTKRGAGKK